MYRNHCIGPALSKAHLPRSRVLDACRITAWPPCQCTRGNHSLSYVASPTRSRAFALLLTRKDPTKAR